MRREVQFVCESSELDRWENEGGRCRTTIRLPTEEESRSLERENRSLHAVLVGTSRGLLQYASECQLWSPPTARRRSALLRRLVSRQQESIRQLGELLAERQFTISWGVFPSEYTRFNYVALEFLWPRLADFQAQHVRMLEAVRADLEGGPLTTSVLDNVIQSERAILTELAAACPPLTSEHPWPHARTGSRNADKTSPMAKRAIRDRRSDCLAVSRCDGQDAMLQLSL